MGVSRRDALRLGLGTAALGMLSACALDTSGAPGGVGSGGLVFYSTQLSTTAEAESVRRQILAGFGEEVQFTADPSTTKLLDRVRAEAQAGTSNLGLVGALQGEFATLWKEGLLRDMTDVVESLGDRAFTSRYLDLARFDGRYAFVPWISASYIMAARREALDFLPAGADLQNLTYAQLLDWTRAIQQATGSARFGLPAGENGLLKRFLQGYAYPSFTGGVNTTFASPGAVTMWEWLQQVWATANPQSVTYGFMQEPLLTGEVWVAWDHAVRLVDALQTRPEDIVSFPAPTGPRGLGYLPVLGGLSIPRAVADPQPSIELIRHLTDPARASTTLRTVAWFPPQDLGAIPGGLPPGVGQEAETLQRMVGTPGALASSLAVGLGGQSGAYDKVFTDTFRRIVLDAGEVRGTLATQAAALQGVLDTAQARCWTPDPLGEGVCRVG
ncbi:ABC transporter substrate-binding protein [Pseudonocardia xishanensis]|uniref:ABC transporter substrate-binding protein n=1 Tax=Pseudonocardia xishanensis TaxID=630995 RepID=A0ABP8RH06_9PSEU